MLWMLLDVRTKFLNLKEGDSWDGKMNVGQRRGQHCTCTSGRLNPLIQPSAAASDNSSPVFQVLNITNLSGAGHEVHLTSVIWHNGVHSAHPRQSIQPDKNPPHNEHIWHVPQTSQLYT
jgi:hypothetical protein